MARRRQVRAVAEGIHRRPLGPTRCGPHVRALWSTDAGVLARPDRQGRDRGHRVPAPHARQEEGDRSRPSWGSIVAVDMVQRRPDLFAAYVGTGQVASWETTSNL